MTESEILQIVQNQKAYFADGKTLCVKERKRYLAALGNAIRANIDDIAQALQADLGKSASESYMCETGLTLGELR